MRRALLQLADGLGVLGLTRSCHGASTSGTATAAGAVSGGCRDKASAAAAAVSTVLPLRWLCSTAATAGAPEWILQPAYSPGLSPVVGAGGGAPLQLQLGRPATWPQACDVPAIARGCSGQCPPPWGSVASVRGYKSNKRSLKPLNTKASWLAAAPVLEEQRVKRELAERGAALGGTAVAGAGGGRRRRPTALGPIVDTAVPDVPQLQLPAEYKRVGTVVGRYTLQPERVFAVVELAGTQFKVTPDDVVFVNQLKGVEVNDVVALDRVLLLGSRSHTVVGRPYVPGTAVLAAVEEHFRDGKVHVFKKRARKRYRKYQAPRPNLTTLRVLKVGAATAAFARASCFDQG